MEPGQPSGSRDPFGLAPLTRAIEGISDSTVRGAGALLSRICLPAAEEFGLLLRDKVSAWRAKNMVRVLNKTQGLLDESRGQQLHAHPRLVIAALEHGSWADADDIQQMWAGLLASSCTPEGTDDSNLLFINLLAQLTCRQTRVLRFACEAAAKHVDSSGLIGADSLFCEIQRLSEIVGTSDLQTIDRELDSLRSLGLLAIGLMGGLAAEPVADLHPTALGLHLYVRCQGSTVSPSDFFGLKRPTDAA